MLGPDYLRICWCYCHNPTHCRTSFPWIQVESGHILLVFSPLITVGDEPGTKSGSVGQLAQVGACYRARLAPDWVLASLQQHFEKHKLWHTMQLLGCARFSEGNGHCHTGGRLGSVTAEGPAEGKIFRSDQICGVIFCPPGTRSHSVLVTAARCNCKAVHRWQFWNHEKNFLKDTATKNLWTSEAPD